MRANPEVGVFIDSYQTLTAYQGDCLMCCLGHQEVYEEVASPVQPAHSIIIFANWTSNIYGDERDVYYTWDQARNNEVASQWRQSTSWYSSPQRSIAIMGQWYDIGEGPVTYYSVGGAIVQCQIRKEYPIMQGRVDLYLSFAGGEPLFSSASPQYFIITDTTLYDYLPEFNNLSGADYSRKGSVPYSEVTESTVDPVLERYRFQFQLNDAALADINDANRHYGGTGYWSFYIRDARYDWPDIPPVMDPYLPGDDNFVKGFRIKNATLAMCFLDSTCNDPIDYGDCLDPWD
jgi:hypothetical protein